MQSRIDRQREYDENYTVPEIKDILRSKNINFTDVTRKSDLINIILDAEAGITTINKPSIRSSHISKPQKHITKQTLTPITTQLNWPTNELGLTGIKDIDKEILI
jgi:hypothetical protein